jgi:radical SAM protein with 4Fe4S-binding SPASM domain
LRARLPGDWVISPRGARIREKLYMEWGDRFIWPDKDAPDGGNAVYCYGLGNQFGILCDGTVVPCCLDSDGVINLGNVFREPLADILSSERAIAIREGFTCRRATEDLCRRCSYARRF